MIMIYDNNQIGQKEENFHILGTFFNLVVVYPMKTTCFSLDK